MQAQMFGLLTLARQVVGLDFSQRMLADALKGGASTGAFNQPDPDK